MLDKIITEFDKMLKTLTVKPASTRPHPDANIDEGEMTLSEKKHSCGLMRVNHCGEMCAQGLYQGQALTARDKSNADRFMQASHEETEHLAWTSQRIEELSGRTSIFDPFFYVGSLALGMTAGLFGDKWSLSFLEETEKQVARHLDSHLEDLPMTDRKSIAITAQMRDDEMNHANMAHELGATPMPKILQLLMQGSSKVMTTVTYYV